MASAMIGAECTASPKLNRSGWKKPGAPSRRRPALDQLSSAASTLAAVAARHAYGQRDIERHIGRAARSRCRGRRKHRLERAADIALELHRTSPRLPRGSTVMKMVCQLPMRFQRRSNRALHVGMALGESSRSGVTARRCSRKARGAASFTAVSVRRRRLPVAGNGLVRSAIRSGSSVTTWPIAAGPCGLAGRCRCASARGSWFQPPATCRTGCSPKRSSAAPSLPASTTLGGEAIAQQQVRPGVQASPPPTNITWDARVPRVSATAAG